MGTYLKEEDVHVENLLGELNLRFSPTPNQTSHFGGIDELVKLQQEFKIFKKGRSFRTSVAVLNVGASNAQARNRLLDYFASLAGTDSNVDGQTGDAAIVAALARNLAAAQPLPVYFTYHDMRAEKGNTRVLITAKARPVSFFQRDFLTVSFPTLPHKPSVKPPKAAKPAPRK